MDPADLQCPGRLCMVEYEDEPGTWHDRLIIREASSTMFQVVNGEPPEEEDARMFWCLTPDGDLYPQELSSPPLRGITYTDDVGKWMPETTSPRLTRNLRRRHKFEPGRDVPCASPMVFLRAHREASAQEARPPHRLNRKSTVEPSEQLVPMLAGEAAPAPPELSPPGDSRHDGLTRGGGAGSSVVACGRGSLPAAGAKEWVVVHARSDELRGQAVASAPREWALRGELGLVVFGDGSAACVAALSPSESEQLASRPLPVEDGPGTPRGDDVPLDARVLTVKRAMDGRRIRSFKEATGELVESTWENWPVQGPRTFLWCAQHIAEMDHHPMAHHLRFRTSAGLQHYDVGVPVHEMAMRVMDFALTYDQLHCSELACLEVVARQAQLVELKYRDKVLANQSGSAGATMLEMDDHLYLGTGRTRGQLMIDPRLEDFVSGELSREAGAAKERRKMREERESQKPPPGETPGKGGGKKK